MWEFQASLVSMELHTKEVPKNSLSSYTMQRRLLSVYLWQDHSPHSHCSSITPCALSLSSCDVGARDPQMLFLSREPMVPVLPYST